MGDDDLDLVSPNGFPEPAELRAVEQFGPGEDVTIDFDHVPAAFGGKGAT
jgi:hypothetical protein